MRETVDTSPAVVHRQGGMFGLLVRLIPERRNMRRQYLYVSVLMLVALGARLVIAPLDGGIQYVTFFPAVALSAVIGGIWVGLYAALIGVVLASYLFWPPYQALVFDFSAHMMLSNAVFLIDAVLVCSAIEAMHRYYGKYVGAENRLRLAASVFDHSTDGIMVTDATEKIVSVNHAFCRMTGYSEAEAVGNKPTLLRSEHHDATFYETMWEALHADGFWQGEIWNRRKNGELFLEWLTLNRIDNGMGGVANYVAVYHDTTKLKEQDEHIRHLAHHDALTALPNRLLLEERIDHTLARARRNKGRLAVLFIDLDGFKPVNDDFGHGIGDRLLREVALRLTKALREEDTVARWGGDEFVILLEGTGNSAAVSRIAETIQIDIAQPYFVEGHEVRIGASMGVAMYPEAGSTRADLLERADAAMYRAKQAGGRRTVFSGDQ